MPRRRPTSMADPAQQAEFEAEAAARRLARLRDLDTVLTQLVDTIPFAALIAAREARRPDHGGSLGMGRPSKLTPDNARLVLRAVLQGNYPSVAMGLISNDETWSQWQDRAAAGEPAYAAFVEAMGRAQAWHHTRTIASVDAQVDTSWRAGIAIAERRYKAHWAPQAAPSGPQAPTVNVQVLAVSDLSGLASLLAPPPSPPQQLIEGQIVVNEQP